MTAWLSVCFRLLLQFFRAKYSDKCILRRKHCSNSIAFGVRMTHMSNHKTTVCKNTHTVARTTRYLSKMHKIMSAFQCCFHLSCYAFFTRVMYWSEHFFSNAKIGAKLRNDENMFTVSIVHLFMRWFHGFRWKKSNFNKMNSF